MSNPERQRKLGLETQISIIGLDEILQVYNHLVYPPVISTYVYSIQTYGATQP